MISDKTSLLYLLIILHGNIGQNDNSLNFGANFRRTCKYSPLRPPTPRPYTKGGHIKLSSYFGGRVAFYGLQGLLAGGDEGISPSSSSLEASSSESEISPPNKLTTSSSEEGMVLVGPWTASAALHTVVDLASAVDWEVATDSLCSSWIRRS